MRTWFTALNVGLSTLLLAIWASQALAQTVPEQRAVYVAPTGNPSAPGSKDSPIDIATAFSDGKVVTPGTVIWIAEGTYSVGNRQIGTAIQGSKDRPIIYRASPGQRATVVGEITIKNDYVWLWGLDLKGAIITQDGDGFRLINMTIHEAGPPTKPSDDRPSGQGIGGWDVGNDHEFYGNLIYHNGWNHFDHGIYSQNTARHTVKRYIDNIVFENAGTGFHLYGESPVLSGLHLEGNICFATSLMPRNPRNADMNIIVGGSKPLSNVVLKNNCTYHPQRHSKRGVEIGYHGSPNTGIVVEDNYFMGGAHAMEMNGVAEAIVRNNTFWAPDGMVAVHVAKGVQPKLQFEGNRYLFNGKFDFRPLFAQTRSNTDTVLPSRTGRPYGLHVFTRVNQYEPGRVHLAVYNWDRKPTVTIVLKDILKAGDSYRVVNVLDFYGTPVVEGKARGAFIRLPMTGHRYGPEFGAYVLFRDRAEDGELRTAAKGDSHQPESGMSGPPPNEAKRLHKWSDSTGEYHVDAELLGCDNGIVTLKRSNGSTICLPVTKLSEEDQWYIAEQTVTSKLAVPLVAPFGAEEAKSHQQAWANYLDLPVEWENSIGMKFVLVPPGEFKMGSSAAEIERLTSDAKRENAPSYYVDKLPLEIEHSVKISRPIYFCQHEVTQKQYATVLDRGDKEVAPAQARQPVDRVTWANAVRFSETLSKRGEQIDGVGRYRLPSEAEWEYACRAGTASRYSFGDDNSQLGEYAWFADNSSRRLHPIGQKRPNAFQLYDMYGNVHEWCADGFDQEYSSKSPPVDRPGADETSSRVSRGGAFTHPWRACRSAARAGVAAARGDVGQGFRVVCEIPLSPQQLSKDVNPSGR